MDDEAEVHGHLASMDLDGSKGRKEALVLSSALGAFVAVVVFGICGRMQRQTFKNTTVSFEDSTRLTVIKEEK